MTYVECRVGARVICVFPGKYNGKTGTITRVERIRGTIRKYYVSNDKGHLIGNTGWQQLTSWDIV